MDGSGSRICIYVLVVLDIVLSDGWMICVALRCVAGAGRCGGRQEHGAGVGQEHGVTNRGTA